MTTVSDAPSCGITYNENSRGGIYNCNVFIK